MSEHTEYNKDVSNSETNKKNTNKQDVVTTITNALITSGLFAKGVQLAYDFVNNRVGEIHRNAHRALLVRILLVVGGMLVVYGGVSITTSYFSIQEWTNLISGVIFILGAGVVYFIQ